MTYNSNNQRSSRPERKKIVRRGKKHSKKKTSVETDIQKLREDLQRQKQKYLTEEVTSPKHEKQDIFISLVKPGKTKHSHRK